MDVPKWPSTKIDPKIIPIFGKNITSFDNIIPNFVEQPINLIIWIFRFVRQPYFFLFKVIPMTVNLRIEAVIAKVLIFIFSFESPIDGLQRRKFEFMLDLSEIRYLQSE